MGTWVVDENRDADQGVLHDRRGQAERLVDLARHLPPRDRALIEQLYDRGLPASDLAVATGQCPRKLQRRAKVVIRRLQSPEYRLLAGHGEQLPDPVRRTARHAVFAGLSYRATALATGQTIHRVRQHLLTLRALAHAVYAR